MPWTPAQAKQKYKRLTKRQSEVWSKVANEALANGDDEATAIKKANAAVNRMRKNESLGEAAVTVVEIGRSISSANMKTLKNSLKAMQDAMRIIAPLIAADSDEEVDESANVLLDTEIDPELKEVATKLEKWELANISEAAKILAQADSYDSVRWAVQSALRKRAISDAMTAKVADGSLGMDDDYYYSGCYPYIRDLYDGYVVYSLDGQLYQCEYEIDDATVTLGDPTEVKISYVPMTMSSESSITFNGKKVNYEELITEFKSMFSVKQPIDVKGDLVQLSEKAVRDDGIARVKLISPGWGSSGYYSAKMLERDGPKVFTKGMHMYMNHPTEEDDRNRPERDLRDLAGVIASDVSWEKASANNTGDGLYADVKVFGPYKEFIDEAAPYIGTSIRAAGTAIEGEAEGRHGLLVDSLTQGYSVDYVTYPGRGGEILSLYESARSKINVTETTKEAVLPNDTQETITVDITQEELDKLKESANKAETLEKNLSEATATIKKLGEAFILSEARNIVSETLATIEMPVAVRERLQKSCVRTVPLTESREIDKDKLVENVKEAATEELKYIETVTGNVTGGRVIGMSQPATTELKEEDVNKALEEAWKEFGFGDKEISIAVGS